LNVLTAHDQPRYGGTGKSGSAFDW